MLKELGPLSKLLSPPLNLIEKLLLKTPIHHLAKDQPTAKIIKSISASFSEEEIRAQLNELERLATNFHSIEDD